MLRITTSNGDTLIHADQQPDSYNGRSADGSTYMVHGGSWGKHKYIRKEGNRYIYPEDVVGKGKKAVSDAADKTKAKLKELKTIAKDKKFLWENRPYDNGVDRHGQTPRGKKIDQITNAHKTATVISKGDNSYKEYYNTRDPKTGKRILIDQSGPGVGFRTGDSAYLKRKRKKQAEDQRKSAHAGYEAERKKFAGDLTSTEELEIQKQKTKARKTQKRVEDVLKKKMENNRPKSRDKKVVSGGKKVKTGKSAGGEKVNP